jgi:hypothetical protein
LNDEKRVPGSHGTEVSGEIEVQRVAHAAGWLYRPRAGLDVGIDLELEPVVDGIPTGRITKVQVKSGASYFERDSGDRFAFRPETKDIKYWHRVNTPVLVVLYHPGDRAAFAVEFHDYAQKNPDDLAKGLIWFDRRHDLLTADLLRAFGGREASSFEPLRSPPLPEGKSVREVLHSNLLFLADTPERLFHVKVDAQNDDDVRKRVGRDTAPFYVWGGELWTFVDPRQPESGLTSLIDPPAVRILDSAVWLMTKDGDIRYRALLYRTLRQHTRGLGLRNDGEDRLFFPSRDGTVRKQRYRSLRQWTQRWVARPIWDRTRTAVSIWEHRALSIELTRVGSRWFLALLPSWCFTSDGRTPVRAPPGAVSRRIAHEYNPDVYRLLVFWRAVMFRSEYRPLCLPCSPQHLTCSPTFLSTPVDFGIPDDRIDLTALEETDDDALSDSEELAEDVGEVSGFRDEVDEHA